MSVFLSVVRYTHTHSSSGVMTTMSAQQQQDQQVNTAAQRNSSPTGWNMESARGAAADSPSDDTEEQRISSAELVLQSELRGRREQEVLGKKPFIPCLSVEKQRVLDWQWKRLAEVMSKVTGSPKSAAGSRGNISVVGKKEEKVVGEHPAHPQQKQQKQQQQQQQQRLEKPALKKEPTASSSTAPSSLLSQKRKSSVRLLTPDTTTSGSIVEEELLDEMLQRLSRMKHTRISHPREYLSQLRELVVTGCNFQLQFLAQEDEKLTKVLRWSEPTIDLILQFIQLFQRHEEEQQQQQEEEEGEEEEQVDEHGTTNSSRSSNSNDISSILDRSLTIEEDLSLTGSEEAELYYWVCAIHELLASISMRGGDVKSAAKHIKQSHAIQLAAYKLTGSRKTAPCTYLLLCSMSSKMGRHDEALDYAELAVKQLEAQFPQLRVQLEEEEEDDNDDDDVAAVAAGDDDVSPQHQQSPHRFHVFSHAHSLSHTYPFPWMQQWIYPIPRRRHAAPPPPPSSLSSSATSLAASTFSLHDVLLSTDDVEEQPLAPVTDTNPTLASLPAFVQLSEQELLCVAVMHVAVEEEANHFYAKSIQNWKRCLILCRRCLSPHHPLADLLPTLFPLMKQELKEKISALSNHNHSSHSNNNNDSFTGGTSTPHRARSLLKLTAEHHHPQQQQQQEEEAVQDSETEKGYHTDEAAYEADVSQVMRKQPDRNRKSTNRSTRRLRIQSQLQHRRRFSVDSIVNIDSPYYSPAATHVVKPPTPREAEASRTRLYHQQQQTGSSPTHSPRTPTATTPRRLPHSNGTPPPPPAPVPATPRNSAPVSARSHKPKLSSSAKKKPLQKTASQPAQKFQSYMEKMVDRLKVTAAKQKGS